MKRMMLPATAALITLTPAVAAAKPPTPAHARAYEHAYHRVAHQLGRRVPGRNIVRDGFAAHQAATDAETVASLGVLERMLAPASTSSTTASGALAGAPSAGGAGVPACASESGTNYSTGASNTNASSGRDWPLPDPALHSGRLRLQSGQRGRPGRLRADDLPAPGRRRLGRLRRLNATRRLTAGRRRPRSGSAGPGAPVQLFRRRGVPAPADLAAGTPVAAPCS